MICGVTSLLVVDWVVSVDEIYTTISQGGEGGADSCGVYTISAYDGGLSVSTGHCSILMWPLVSPSFSTSVIDAHNVLLSIVHGSEDTSLA